MQFLAIQIRADNTVRQIYYRYGSFTKGYWNSALFGSNREHLRDFNSISIKEAILSLAEQIEQIGTVTQIRALSDDTLYPCMLREYFSLPDIKIVAEECAESLSLAS